MVGSFNATSVLVAVFIAIFAESAAVTVMTDVGTFIGISQVTQQLDGSNATLNKFLGIPYAEPPVGEYRFQVPRPKAKLPETWNATELGSACLTVSVQTQGSPESEDCLFLNIFAPEIAGNETLAVMILIHGGAFTSGTGGTYDASFMALVGHVIMVTVNYRLSAWGFLSTGSSELPGNYGLWDQQMAIQWVSKNIGAFNGDKARITIFGESAGAASVGHQALYPGNKDLFNGVITMSGSASASWALRPNPREDALELASYLNCNGTDSDTLLKCFQDAPAMVIHNILNNRIGREITRMFKPSLDKFFVVANPSEILNSKSNDTEVRLAREAFVSFNFLTGTIPYDGGIMLFGYAFDLDNFLPDRQTFEDVLIPRFFNNYNKHEMSSGDEQFISDNIIAKYTVWEDPENREKIRVRLVEMFGDADFHAPQEEMLEVHTLASSKTTYMYSFETPVISHGIPTPSWFGTKPNHADDIVFLFPPPEFFISEDIPKYYTTMATEMTTMWTNFAKTGNPNLPNDLGKNWLPYTPSRHSYLQITGSSDTDSVKERLREGHTHFWNTVVPMLITTVQQQQQQCDGSGDG